MEPFKTILEQQLKELDTELKRIAVLDEATGDWVARPETVLGEADPNLSADVAEDWGERRATIAQLETRYHNVLLALKKFSANSFGRCEICGEEIDTTRLTVHPAARTCQLHLERERELPL
jgi:RNA polymerase-binding transcription factor DksA